MAISSRSLPGQCFTSIGTTANNCCAAGACETPPSSRQHHRPRLRPPVALASRQGATPWRTLPLLRGTGNERRPRPRQEQGRHRRAAQSRPGMRSVPFGPVRRFTSRQQGARDGSRNQDRRCGVTQSGPAATAGPSWPRRRRRSAWSTRWCLPTPTSLLTAEPSRTDDLEIGDEGERRV